jgi:hypothetical protein
VHAAKIAQVCSVCNDAAGYCEACGGSSSREALLGVAATRGRYWGCRLNDGVAAELRLPVVIAADLRADEAEQDEQSQLKSGEHRAGLVIAAILSSRSPHDGGLFRFSPCSLRQGH